MYNIKLNNFYFVCRRCGVDVRIHQLFEIRECPKCGEKVELSHAIRKHLWKEELNRLAMKPITVDLSSIIWN